MHSSARPPLSSLKSRTGLNPLRGRLPTGTITGSSEIHGLVLEDRSRGRDVVPLGLLPAWPEGLDKPGERADNSVILVRRRWCLWIIA